MYDFLELGWAMFWWHWLATVPGFALAVAVGYLNFSGRVAVPAIIVLMLGCGFGIPMVPGAERGSGVIVYMLAPVYAILYILIGFAVGVLAFYLVGKLAERKSSSA